MSDQPQVRTTQGCKNHPPLPAKVHCRDCNAPLCSICSKFVDGKFLCEECVAANVARKIALSANVVSGSFQPGAIARTPAVGVALPAAKPTTAAIAVAPGMPALSGKPPTGSVPLGSVRFDRQVAAAHPATGMPNVVPGSKTAFVRGGSESQRISGRKYSCRNHPGVEAGVKCELCGSLYCADCIKETRKKMLCPDCARPGGRSALLTRTAVMSEPQDFSNRVPGAFLSPLLSERKYLLILAPPALWMGCQLHWAAAMAVIAFMALWLMKITRRAAQNLDDKSTFPSLDDSTNDIVKPFFNGLLAVVVLMLPILVYLPLGEPEIMRKSLEYLGLSGSNTGAADSERLLQYITSHAAGNTFIVWALLAAAALLPLCLGMLGLFGRSDVLSPPMLGTALSRIGVYYAMVLGILAFAFIPTWYVAGVMKEFSGPLGLVCAFLITYFSMVAFRIFGDVYLTNKGLFEFYGRPVIQS